MKGYEELKGRIEAAKIALDDIVIAYIIGIVFGFVLTYAIKISISVAWLR